MAQDFMLIKQSSSLNPGSKQSFDELLKRFSHENRVGLFLEFLGISASK